MATAKSALETKVDKLVRTLEKGLAAVDARMERGFAAVAEDMSRLATKEDILRIEERLVSIEQELKDIKRRLTALEDRFDRFGEKNKEEIEELWKHVAAIEKRLKMQR